jgi:hypothetical protein
MAWWAELYYNAANTLTGKAVSAATQPNVPLNSNIVAVLGPYQTRAEAQAEIAGSAGEHALTGLPGDLATAGAGIGGAVSGLLNSPVNPSAGAISTGEQAGISTSGFLGDLTSRALWTRIAEGTLGVLLIAVGVAKLAEGSPIAKTVAKAGLI